jgi:hypothetical protein
VFPGKVEAFSVYRIFLSIGVVSVQLLVIALSNASPYIFLGIILCLQIVMAAVALKLKKLNPNQQSLKSPLMTNKSSVLSQNSSLLNANEKI